MSHISSTDIVEFLQSFNNLVQSLLLVGEIEYNKSSTAENTDNYNPTTLQKPERQRTPCTKVNSSIGRKALARMALAMALIKIRFKRP